MKMVFIMGAVVLAACLFGGCVNKQRISQLTSNMQALNAKIIWLERGIKALRP